MSRRNGLSPEQVRALARLGVPLYDIVRAAHVRQSEIAKRASIRALSHGDSAVSRMRVGQVLHGYVMVSAQAKSKAWNGHILRETARALGVTYSEVRAWWDRLPPQLVGDKRAARA